MNTKTIGLVVSTLNQMGVTLKDMDIEKSTPEFYIEVDRDRLLEDFDDTLESAYGVLWTLCYGKVSDSNRHLKIKLNYTEVGEIVS